MLSFYLSLIDDNDRSLFEDVYLKNRKQMFYLARKIVRTDEDAEDIVHDVFCKVAASHINILKNALCDEDIRNYLLKATKNTALNTLKKRKVRFEYEEDSEIFLELSDKDFLDELCNRLEAEELISAIKELPTAYSEALYYRFVLGLTVREIAELLNKKPQTVSKQITRGKALLLAVRKGDEENVR